MIDWRRPFRRAAISQAETPERKAKGVAVNTQRSAEIGALIMHEHGRESLAQARQRACHYHQAQLKSSGFNDLAEEPCIDEEDPMGSITSIGEQHVTHQYQEKSAAPLWLAGILSAAGAGLLTGLGAWILLGPDSPDFVDTNTDTKYKFGLSVEPGGALGGSEGEDD